MDLLRWFRFWWAGTGVDGDKATRVGARDFCRWLRVTGKQPRPHWRTGDRAGALVGVRAGEACAPSVRARSGAVLRAFYDFRLDVGSGPVSNPFGLDRSRRGGRADAHHNPMAPFGNGRAGLCRPGVPERIPRGIPGGEFSEIFAGLPSHRDRALAAFYGPAGARASELLPAALAGIGPGRQLITAVREGTGELQELPASTGAFVWLRLYQVEMAGLIPHGRRQPLWWAARRPARPLTYHAVHRVFERVNAAAGTTAAWPSLRHPAACRVAGDPARPLTGVQLLPGHSQLMTTQVYLTPRQEDVIRRILAHHAGPTRRAPARARPALAPGYRPGVLDVLFGNGAS
jgi:integrase